MVIDHTEVKTNLETDKLLNTLPLAAGILPIRASRQPFGTWVIHLRYICIERQATA